MTEIISIQKGNCDLAVAPALGGTVTHFRWKGHDIIRPASAEAIESGDILGTGGFLMSPFTGRINHGRFTYEGKEIQLDLNFPPEVHAIHGQAWQGPWKVTAQSDDSITLVYTHDGKSWPWTYETKEVFTLTDDGLSLEMVVTNTSNSNMPTGIGWHSYFPRGDATLQANVTAVWNPASDMIPSAASPLEPFNDIRVARVVDSLDLDHPYDLPDTKAVISWPSTGVSVAMESDKELGGLVVYIPPGKDFFCVEPASNVPDAVNLGLDDAITGLRHLAPGESFSVATRLTMSQS